MLLILICAILFYKMKILFYYIRNKTINKKWDELLQLALSGLDLPP